MPRLLTFFKALAMLCLASWNSLAASVSGSVLVSGRSKASNDLIVWLEPQDPHPIEESATPPHRTLLQKNKMFTPHVLPITVGTIVDFPNADPIFHNAFSNYDGQIFDVSLYPPHTSRSVRFRRPGVVRVFCNIHPMMSAIILVLDTPYFTRVDSQGRYRFDDVAVGAYEVHVFDERATDDKPDPPSITLTQDSRDVTAPAIHISEAGYVPAPHRNKYGREYPPEASSDTYSAIPQ